jgi:hypothetical protein
MARPLVVKGEGLADVTGLDQAALEIDPAQRRACRARRALRSVGREQWVQRQRVLDVHQDQLLMLLLVMQPKLDQVGRIAAVGGDQLGHRLGDVSAIGEHLVDARPGDHAAPGPRMPRADRLVVRIEQVLVGGIERTIGRELGLEQKGFEEPRGMRQVPLGGAGVGHRLDGLVFGRQRFGERFGLATNPSESIEQREGVRGHATRYQFRHDTSASRLTRAENTRLRQLC